nr:hypothetical protein SORBI_3001G020350 [Ipomoea trifida]
MDDITTRIINNPFDRQPSLHGPNGVRSNRIRKRQPKRNKQHPGVEIHPPQQSTRNEDQRNRRENELEIHHSGIGEVPQKGMLKEIRLFQCNINSPPNWDQLLTKRKLVSPAHPAHKNASEGVERHESRVHSPFLLHCAAVEVRVVGPEVHWEEPIRSRRRSICHYILTKLRQGGRELNYIECCKVVMISGFYSIRGQENLVVTISCNTSKAMESLILVDFE